MAAHFYEENLDDAHYRRLNEGAESWAELDLDLRIYGGGVQTYYALLPGGGAIQPFVTGGIGLYRWFALRGSYQLAEGFVPERRQSDWSWGMNAGLGVTVRILSALSFSLNIRYQLIIGELWPALALQLENVSGMQMLENQLMLRWHF